ncbi:MAG: hypothetical protein HY078_14915 [Elusimicrobia bacterium]|nr:hypothetical protein [Elusimicrobiota bacterium]
MMAATVGSSRGFKTLVAAVFAASFAYCLALFKARANTDIQIHARFVVDMLDGKAMPAHFLYFWLVALVTLFSRDFHVVLVGSAAVVAAATAARFAATAAFLRRRAGSVGEGRLFGSVLLLSFAHSLILPGLKPYLGQFPPNVWHNSTTIALVPLALLLFWTSDEYLASDGRRLPWALPALVVLNVLVKPSFFLVFAPVFPLFALARFGWSAAFFKSCGAVLAGAVPLALQFKHIYVTPATYGVLATNTGGLRLDPLHVWRHFSTNLPLSFVASTAFPLAYFLIHGKAALEDRTYRFSLACFGAALAIFCAVSESGPWEFYGDYLWQLIVCNYLLFMTSLAGAWREYSGRGRADAKDKALGALLALHAASGVYIMVRILVVGAIY